MNLKKELFHYGAKILIVTEACERVFDSVGNVTASGTLDDGTEIDLNILDMLGQLIAKNYKVILPYNQLENLYIDVVVYDSINKTVCKINEINNDNITIQSFNGIEHVKFEKERFYPVYTIENIMEEIDYDNE